MPIQQSFILCNSCFQLLHLPVHVREVNQMPRVQYSAANSLGFMWEFPRILLGVCMTTLQSYSAWCCRVSPSRKCVRLRYYSFYPLTAFEIEIRLCQLLAVNSAITNMINRGKSDLWGSPAVPWRPTPDL